MSLAPAPLRVAMVAGEPSGDLLAASLLEGLNERLPAGTQFNGIGGPRMTAAGFDAHWPMDKLTVRGYVEALKHIPEILGIRNELKRQLLAEPPSVFIGVDAPDFNFGLEHALRDAGIPTVHFVCPSIWAWRGGRIKKIVKAVDHMLCVFPFETALMEKAGIASTYVGHPLADEIPLVPDVEGARRALGLPEGGPIIAVLPGSRRSEIALIGPTFFDAMEIMQLPRARCAFRHAGSECRLARVVAAAGCRASESCADDHRRQRAGRDDCRRRHPGQERHGHARSGVAQEADGHLVQGALADGPDHATAGLSAVCRLPNILAGRFVVPEILQHFATPEALADATLKQLNDEANRATLTEIFTEMHHALRQNTAQRASEAVAQVLETRRPR
jgi:lipid-A-disaccharide synthase